MKAKLVLFALSLSLILPMLTFAQSPSLVISQIQVSGDGGASDEFIEIFNPTASTINLADWSLQYKTASGVFPLTTKKNLGDVNIPAGRYVLIANSAYNGSVTADITHSVFAMSGSSTGATVFLVHGTALLTSATDATIVDKVGYGTSLTNSPEGSNAPLPGTEEALIRVGTDTDNNSTDFQIAPSDPRNSAFVPTGTNPPPPPPTPQPLPPPPPAPQSTPPPPPVPQPNPPPPPAPQPNPPPPPAPTPNPPPPPAPQPTPPPPPAPAPANIVINEIFPHPASSQSEFIELKNIGTGTVNLKGWSISVGNKTYTFVADELLNAGAVKVMYKKDSQFVLSNKPTQKLILTNPAGNQIQVLEFQNPLKRQSYSRNGGGYIWTNPSPGQ